MNIRPGRLLALVTVCMALGLAMSASAASAAECASVTGSGSSLQNVAQTTVWETGFIQQVKFSPEECAAQPQVTYTATSSGRGLSCWGSNTREEIALTECGNGTAIDGYIGTDVAPEGSATTGQIGRMDRAGRQNGATNNSVTAFPVAQSAIAVLVALPENCEVAQQARQLKLIGEIKYADLEEAWFTGQLKLAQIKIQHELQPEKFVGIPLEPCQPLQIKEGILIARSSASGTTAGFKRYLDQVKNKDWESSVRTAEEAESTNWPAKENIQIAAPRGKEEAEDVFKTPNSEGYADLADARAAGFTSELQQRKNGQVKYYVFYAWIQDKPAQEQRYVYQPPEILNPQEEQFEGSNCHNTTYEEPRGGIRIAPNVDLSGLRQNNSFEGVYPICTLTFDIAWLHYGFFNEGAGAQPRYNKDAGTANTVLDYFHYITTVGQQQTKLDQAHYGSLPPSIATKAAQATSSNANIGL